MQSITKPNTQSASYTVVQYYLLDCIINQLSNQWYKPSETATEGVL